MIEYTKFITVNPTSEAMRTIRLKDTIREDCRIWEKLRNLKRTENPDTLCLDPGIDGEITGLYVLLLNGNELWYGTLREINAVVKTMVMQLASPERYAANPVRHNFSSTEFFTDRLSASSALPQRDNS